MSKMAVSMSPTTATAMAVSKSPTTPTAMFTREDIEKNHLTKDQQGQCMLKKNKLDCVDSDGLKYSIKINNLNGIEMFGTYSINKHRYENIIAMTSGKNIKFLKFDTRQQMERWYSELMKPLRREGWTEEEVECEPGRRYASNPEGLQRPNNLNKHKKLHATVSAGGALQNGFIPTKDKRRHAIYEIPREPLTEIQSSGSSTDSSDDDEGGSTKTAYLPDYSPSASAYGSNANTGCFTTGQREEASYNSGSTITVIGDRNIVINGANQQPGSELNISIKEPFDVNVIAELASQISKVLLPELTDRLLLKLTRGSTAGNESTGVLQNNPILHRTSQQFAENSAQLHQVKEGSIVFVVRFKTKEDLKRFWQAYTSGSLTEALTKCLVTSDLEKEAGCKVTLQINIQESVYDKGLQVLDAAVSEPLYVVPQDSREERHDYVNIPTLAKVKPLPPKRKESILESTSAHILPRQTDIVDTESPYVVSSFNIAPPKSDRLLQETMSNQTCPSPRIELRKSGYMSLLFNQNPLSPPEVNSTTVTTIKAKSKPPQVLTKPKGRLTPALCHNETADAGTADPLDIATEDVKPSSVFKAKLSTLLHMGMPALSSTNMASIAEDDTFLEVDAYDYADPKFDEDPNCNPHQELYETFEHAQEDKLIQKSRSLHIASSNAPSLLWSRKQSLPLSINKAKGVMTPDQPQLPWRNGETLLSSISAFRSFQEEDSISVSLNKAAILNGKRLSLVKVKGLTYIWVDHWDPTGSPLEEKIHPGDQILSINGKELKDCDVTMAYKQISKSKEQEIELVIRRAPYASVIYIQRSASLHNLGIELEGNVIAKVHRDGLFSKVSKSKTTGVLSSNLVEWAITEINMQPVNHNYTSDQIRELLDKAISHIALVIQPSDLIQAMEKALHD